MKSQVFNPYLPSYEYIPDAEPYVFDHRVYIYGSHDRFNAPIFCMNDYVCWSAPVEDLSDWRYEGIIYRKYQDPKNKLGLRLLFAPDVTKGQDGRYYLYYGIDFSGIIGVAVCDTPAGEYQFLGHIRYPDGTLLGRKRGDHFPFDPGVLVDDDGKVYLYSGFSLSIPRIATGFCALKSEGGVVMELEPDMITIRQEPKLIFPKSGAGSFEHHEFFEASSIRKIRGKYYFVYSSRHNHELCYAVSDSPMGGFQYGGTLVSIGDLRADQVEEESLARNYMGNTHGGLLELNGQWYIFYHRQTNRHSYSRQACAEAVTLNDDGSFEQAGLTSCGLNGGPLRGSGRYEARIACFLWSKEGAGRYDAAKPRRRYAKHPYFTQSGKDGEADTVQYIANMQDGAVAGYRYFQIEGTKSIEVEIRGEASGKILIAQDQKFTEVKAAIPVSMTDKKNWSLIRENCMLDHGIQSLYIQYIGEGVIDLLSFSLITFRDNGN